MRFWPSDEDRDPRWVVTQILFAFVIALLTAMNYTSDLKDWRVLCLMLAMWGGFALATLKKPSWMKEREARWREEALAHARAKHDAAETERLKGQWGDAI